MLGQAPTWKYEPTAVPFLILISIIFLRGCDHLGQHQELQEVHVPIFNTVPFDQNKVEVCDSETFQ